MNWIGLACSYIFIFVALGISAAMLRKGIISASTSRSIVHISVAHWWLIAMITMDNVWIASIAPLSFIVLNAISLKRGLFSAMETEKRNPGTVYFPISLLVLVQLCYRGVMPLYVGAIGALVMGWGDGLAAVVGKRLGHRKVRPFGSTKTLSGSVTMLAASWIVVLVFTVAFRSDLPWPLAVLVVPGLTALFAAAVELITPFGLDNLTVPLLTVLFYWGVFVR